MQNPIQSVRNPVVQQYLEFVEETESPRLFHIWCLLSCAAACIGRRANIPFGDGGIFPNMYVLLVGPPGVRKNTAINTPVKIVRSAVKLRFAPNDTGGQRQGLIKAFIGEKEELRADEEMQQAFDMADIEALGKINVGKMTSEHHQMFAVATEFESLIGTNARELCTFLQKMWDCEPYDYHLKNEQVTIEDPCFNILAGSNPTAIAESLPKTAIGQGLTSRCILVFGPEKYKDVDWPDSLEDDDRDIFRTIFKEIWSNIRGDFQITSEAKKKIIWLNHVDHGISDTRFIHYLHRRQAHLIKLCMNLAALECSMTIELNHVEDAQLILSHTEKDMPDALGEYGMSPLSFAKQRIVEFLRNQKIPVKSSLLYSIMERDIPRPADFYNSMSDLISAKKVMQVTIEGEEAYLYKERADPKIAEVIDILTAKEE